MAVVGETVSEGQLQWNKFRKPSRVSCDFVSCSLTSHPPARSEEFTLRRQKQTQHRPQQDSVNVAVRVLDRPLPRRSNYSYQMQTDSKLMKEVQARGMFDKFWNVRFWYCEGIHFVYSDNLL